MTWLSVAIGGVAGAVLRDRLQHRLNPPTGSGFPLATALINLSGALILGLVVGWRRDGDISTDTALLLGVGFCGAYTTWSGFVWEWFRLQEQAKARLAWRYLLASLVVGPALAALGLALA